MKEHIKRYDDFARFLNKYGIVVYGMDMRGHGTTGKTNGLGYFAKKDGWQKILEDQKDLYKAVKLEDSDLPFFLLGHSMGSFLARDYINKNPDDFHAAIIMATGKADDPLYKLARFLLKVLDPSKEAKFIDSMAFSSYNKFIKKPRTQFDWLSKDENQVDKYIDDPLCGFMVKNSFYRDFMDGMKSIASQEKKPCFERKVLFLAGLEDPVARMGKYVNEVAKKYPNKNLILYPDMRHEILNELDKNRVYEDILSWINDNLLGNKS